LASATLAQIEQEAAARLGPYELLSASATTASTQTLFVADDLSSSAESGDRADYFLLRRGLLASGAAVGGFVAADRVRRIKLYDPDGTQGNGVAGSLLVDRVWTNAPVANEQAEIHALDPAKELRFCVQRGLERCYFLDRVQVALYAYNAERDVTAALPWLTRPQMIYGAYYLPTGSVYAPRPIPWFEPFEQGGHVYLGASPDPYPFAFYLRVLRPASSVVNNLYAPPSPAATDVVTGGSLAANTAYYAATAALTGYGTSPASAPTLLYTAADGSGTHVARLLVPQVPGANSYQVYLSTAALPLLVATVTEAQRLAGCTVTAQNTVTATSPAAGTVDVRVAGSGTAAVPAAGPQNDADVVNVDAVYPASAAHVAAWRYFRPRMASVAAEGMYPSKDEAVAEFTRQARLRIKPPVERVQLSAPFGPRGLGSGGGWWDV